MIKHLPLLLFALAGVPGSAQIPAPVAPAAAPPGLDQSDVLKLVWSTMLAVDHANRTGNYSVLRDLAAPGFQVANDQAKLTQIFSNLRSTGVDLSNTLLLAPNFARAPEFVRPDMIRVRGSFGMRPSAIAFDLAYQLVDGQWRLFGIGISPSSMATQGSVAAPQPGAVKRPTGR